MHVGIVDPETFFGGAILAVAVDIGLLLLNLIPLLLQCNLIQLLLLHLLDGIDPRLRALLAQRERIGKVLLNAKELIFINRWYAHHSRLPSECWISLLISISNLLCDI